MKQRDDCDRIVLEPVSRNHLICPVRAFTDYVSHCSNLGFQLDDRFAKFSREHVPLSFDRLLVMLNSLVPPIVATSSVKGHFTGHSFRRGHAQAAISMGIEVDDLMLFGNWKSVPSVVNYTAGAVKASALSRILFQG